MLFKTLLYWFVVLVVRFLERVVEFGIGQGGFVGLGRRLVATFSWRRFAAVQISILVLFLI